MAVKKAPNPTLEKNKKKSKEVIYLGDYYDMKSMQPYSVTMTFLELLAEKLTKWVTGNPDALAITEFWELIGMSPNVYYSYVKRCPALDRAHEYALAVIGSHREVGAMKKKLETSAVWKNQYQYHESYKEAMIFAAQLAKKEDKEQEGNKVFIVVEKIESTPEMQELFKKKES